MLGASRTHTLQAKTIRRLIRASLVIYLFLDPRVSFSALSPPMRPSDARGRGTRPRACSFRGRLALCASLASFSQRGGVWPGVRPTPTCFLAPGQV